MIAPLMPSRGFSDAAEYVEEMTSDSRRFLDESVALGMRNILREELASVWEECKKPGWDGYGALPVTEEALLNAFTFLRSLPLGFPRPYIGAEPDGEITLEWHHSAKRTLSVSVTPDGYLHYAALLGPSRTYGTEVFFEEIPDTILELIQRVVAS